MNANTSLTTTVNQIIPLGDMERMAVAITKSGLFGMKTQDQALALMLVAQAEGKHPASIAAEYDIIQGRAALKSNSMLARFQQAGGRVEWHDHTDQKVSATFSHQSGGSLKIEWDMARAKTAGLGGKDNWNKYPRQMLRARVISEGVRSVYPAVLNGMYAPEEVQDFSSPTRQTVTLEQVKSAAPAPAAAPEPTVVEAEVVQEASAKRTRKPKAEPVAETPELSWEDTLEPRIVEVEENVTQFLAAKAQIAYGETWRDVKDPEYRQRMLANTERFLGAVKAFVGEDAK